MMAMRVGWMMAGALTAVLVPGIAGAQQAGNANDPWCKDGGGGDRSHYCEVRELTMLPPSGVLTVNARPNGGIAVTAWDRRDVAIRAKVTAQAENDEQAQALVKNVVVRAEGDTIAAQGPERGEERSWSVSYQVSVPFDHPLALGSVNGGISVTGMRGEIDLKTQNGGVTLTNVGGKVKGRTQNGGIKVALDGDRWQGDSLDVETQNGGIVLTVPDRFAAHLETSTVNGRVKVDFPVMMSGEVTSRQVTTDLNGGGPSVRLVTTNGGVSVRKK